MNIEEIFEKLKGRFSEAVVRLETPEEGVDGESWIVVKASDIKSIGKFLKQDPDLFFDYLACETAVDEIEKITMVYILFSYPLRHKVMIKAEIPRDRPEIETVEDLWGAANWFEREIFDLFGVLFHGHSNLRRIMLPEDWIGHPLLKDYKEPEEYRGWSHQRETSIKSV